MSYTERSLLLFTLLIILHEIDPICWLLGIILASVGLYFDRKVIQAKDKFYEMLEEIENEKK